jgi:hypothetical protein
MSVSPPVPAGPGLQEPGIQAPFPAPPNEGSGTRLGWALGIAGAALVLCCGGGFVAFLGFGVTQVAALNEQSRVVVSEYLDALREDKFDDAYKLLCDSQQARQSKEAFTAQQENRPQIRGYDLGEFDINNSRLPVTERYADGSTDLVTYYLEPDSQTAQLEICGRE